MKHAGVISYQSLFFAFAAIALFALLNVFPMKASALEIAVKTQQLLPLGANSCAQVSVSNFTPYIYDGALNSFEFTISDSSYVALAGSAGDTSIPFQFMTRRTDPSGTLHIHVDIATTPLTGTVPVSVTLLSAKTGQPTCVSVVATNLGSGPVVNTVPAAPSYPTTPTKPAAPSSPATMAPVTSPVSMSSTSAEGGTVATSVAPVSAMSPLKSLCTSATSAYRLWLILLVLYALVVGGLLWAEFPMSWTWAKTPERIATIILGLLVLLLGFWYFSIACRAALWMPLLAFLIAILGLLAAFWNHPRVTQLLLIQETTPTSTTIITPPARK